MAQLGKVFIAGHTGMAGGAIMRNLQSHGQQTLLLKRSNEVDLCNWEATKRFMQEVRPDVVIVAAAKVGGILANQRSPVEFFIENTRIAVNTIQAAYEAGVKRLLFLGSSCIYPREAAQPMAEESLLSGTLEPTNEAYALAKIGGLKLCEYYRRQYDVCYHSVMPTNLYGPGDNYHSQDSHVLPALIRKFHEAKVSNTAEVCLWGTGRPRREFLHVDDLAEAIYHLLICDNPPDLVNIGWGQDISIGELAEKIKEVIGFEGKITYDTSYPDGAPRKLLDISLITQLGWFPKIGLVEGLAMTYSSFLKEIQQDSFRCEPGCSLLK